jgi:iron complex outermembrane receptor protein/vitamin B12 transporter
LNLFARSFLRRSASILAFAACGSSLYAVSVRGSVLDTLGRPIPNAIVALVDNGQVVVTVKSGADGTYQMSTGSVGRFYVLATGASFRQVATESFYGGVLASVEKDITLEPETQREAIVVTATGTPQSTAQISESVTRLGALDLQNFANVTDALRTVPGFHLVQAGERGSQTSLFIRGGNSDDNKILLDGVPLEDIGGTFDFANLSTTGIASAEAYRGPDSVLYGADAGAGVVAFSTPRGSTPFPSLFYEGDGGNFGTYRNQVQAGGTHNAIDYYGGFSDLQETNSIPNDSYHDATSTANLGYAIDARTTLRVSARNSDSATGSPGQYAFSLVANDATQKDQNLFLSGLLDHTFSDTWHGSVNYGLARKREQYQQYSPTGEYVAATEYTPAIYLGQQVTVTGANGYTVSGQTILNYAGTYPAGSNSSSNRDSLYAQTYKSFTPHLTAVAGFRYQNERGAYLYPVYAIDDAVQRTNYDYTLEVEGDLHSRFFYNLGGGVEKNQLYGVVGAPHLGASYYVVRPGTGILHGTRLNFNFSKGYKEPTLFEQTDSLYAFLLANGGSTTVNNYQVKPIGAALTRSYDGGVEQSLFDERVLVRATYFHNEFGNQIESVATGQVPLLLPNLSAAQQASLEALLKSSYESPDLNSLSYRAEGAESEVQYGVRRNLFLRGGYTYLDTRVQQSFSSSALSPYYSDSDFPSIPIGASSPLVGARTFRRPPHTGFVSAIYTDSKGKWTAAASGSFASRSDDSTYLAYSDANFGNSLLLPNRNLDSAYANLNIGATYNVKAWGAVYTQLDNVLSQQHISPIGYLSQPMTVRGGVRLTLGKSAK